MYIYYVVVDMENCKHMHINQQKNIFMRLHVATHLI